MNNSNKSQNFELLRLRMCVWVLDCYFFWQRIKHELHKLWPTTSRTNRNAASCFILIRVFIALSFWDKWSVCVCSFHSLFSSADRKKERKIQFVNKIYYAILLLLIAHFFLFQMRRLKRERKRNGEKHWIWRSFFSSVFGVESFIDYFHILIHFF